jgi:hypothetical protein
MLRRDPIDVPKETEHCEPIREVPLAETEPPILVSALIDTSEPVRRLALLEAYAPIRRKLRIERELPRVVCMNAETALSAFTVERTDRVDASTIAPATLRSPPTLPVESTAIPACIAALSPRSRVDFKPTDPPTVASLAI